MRHLLVLLAACARPLPAPPIQATAPAHDDAVGSVESWQLDGLVSMGSMIASLHEGSLQLHYLSGGESSQVAGPVAWAQVEGLTAFYARPNLEIGEVLDPASVGVVPAPEGATFHAALVAPARLFVTAKLPDGTLVMKAIERTCRKVEWEAPVDGETAKLTGAGVALLHERGTLRVLDGSTGEERWRDQLGSVTQWLTTTGFIVAIGDGGI